MQLYKLKKLFYFCSEVIRNPTSSWRCLGQESTVMPGEEPGFFSKNFEPLIRLNNTSVAVQSYLRTKSYGFTLAERFLKASCSYLT